MNDWDVTPLVVHVVVCVSSFRVNVLNHVILPY